MNSIQGKYADVSAFDSFPLYVDWKAFEEQVKEVHRRIHNLATYEANWSIYSVVSSTDRRTVWRALEPLDHMVGRLDEEVSKDPSSAIYAPDDSHL